MRIAVMGAGGMGGYLGAFLARADNEVNLIARGAHLQAIRQNGLRLKRPEDDFTVRVNATNDPGEVGPVELVLFTVKTYQNAVAIPAMRPLVGPDTCVLTLQNGVESPEELAQVLGPECVLTGVAYTGGDVEAPGIITDKATMLPIYFGESDGIESARAKGVADTF